MSIDPLAGYGDQDRYSPYAAMGDEPVTIADPLGLDGGNTTPPYFEGKEFLPSGSDVGTTHIIGYRIPDFSIRNFFGAVNAGGYWGSTSPGGSGFYGGGIAGGSAGKGAYTSGVNKEGTLQSLAQSIGNNANENPDVATDNNGQDGYNSNYEGKTGDNGNGNGDGTQGNPTVLPEVTVTGKKSSIFSKLWNGIAEKGSIVIGAIDASRGVEEGITSLDKSLSDVGYVKGLKGAGKVLGVTAGLITVGEVLYNKQINASNILDAAVTGASFIPVVGWAIGGGYFLADLITRGVTGESIGQHLDDAVGHPLYDWH